MSDETSNSEQEAAEETTPPAGSTPPPPPPPPAAPAAPETTHTPRLLRREEGKAIAGVCSGLAAYTGIDVVVWRIGFVIFGLTSIGVLIYIVLWLVMPVARPGEPIPTPQHNMDVGRWVGIGAIVLGALIAFRGLFGFFDVFHRGIFWGIALILVGVAIWGRDWNGGSPKRPPPPPQRPAQTPWWPTPSETAASPTVTSSHQPTPEPPASASVTTPMATTPMASRPVAPRPSPAPKARREPSILGRLVVGAAALAVGAALLLENLGVYRVTPKGMLGVLLGIMGVGLIVGAWAGRARWLIIPGTLAAFALVTISLIPFNLRGGWGEIAWSPQSADEIVSNYEHSAGQAALDLSEVDFGRDDREIDVRLGFGELYIVLPDDPDVVVDAHVQAGEMSLFGRVTEGWDVEQQRVRDDGDAKRAGTVTIDAQVTFGEIHVLRGTSDDVPGLVNDRFDRGPFGFENQGG